MIASRSSSCFNSSYFVNKPCPVALTARAHSMATIVRTAVPFRNSSCMILPCPTRVLGGLDRLISWAGNIESGSSCSFVSRPSGP
jgi:hypothetical protein